MKPKKQHEIARLGSLVKLVSERSNINQIVDIGSGVGHLSRLLAYAHELKTVSIDAKDNHGSSARSFDDQLEKQLQKQIKYDLESTSAGNNHQCNTGGLPAGPVHLTQYVDFNDQNTFVETLASYFSGMCVIKIFLVNPILLLDEANK